MAAPAFTARAFPTGFKLPDGYQSSLNWASFSGAEIQPGASEPVETGALPLLWVTKIKPFGIDGEEKIMTSTMANAKWRTYYPRALLTLTDGSFEASYDPDVYASLLLMTNFIDAITQQWPDGTQLAVWAHLQKADFGELEEGKMPVMNGTIAADNWDPVNGVEAGPAFIGGSGTS